MTNPVRNFILKRDNAGHAGVLANCIDAIRAWAGTADLQVKLSDVKRTLDQNAAMWPALRDIADQVAWPPSPAEPLPLEPEDWKDLLTAAYTLEVRAVPALSGGGFVMLGARTSKYSRRQMGEFLTFVRATGDDLDVRWSAPARESFDEYIPRGDAP